MSKHTPSFTPTFARKITEKMNTTVNLVFADITERATMLSAFEAKQAINANGESMFSDVRIHNKDHEAITTYIREGAKILEAQLASTFAIDSTDDAIPADPSTTPPTPAVPATKIIWTFNDIDARRTKLNADKFQEALVCYVLSRWLENKIQGTAQAYTAMFKDLSEAAIKTAKTKRKPARPQS